MAEPGHSQTPFDAGSRPIPDPTVLTTQQLLRAIAAERDFVLGQIAVIDTRLDSMDTATELRLRGIVDIPEMIDRRVKSLADLMDEKFDSIAKQFAERDTRSERESRDNKVAVDAAFAAQKESAAKQDETNAKAIDKSEKATAETIKTNQELTAAKTDALTKGLDEVKLAVNSILATGAGRQDQVVEARAHSVTSSAWVGVGLAALAVSITVVGIIAALAASQP